MDMKTILIIAALLGGTNGVQAIGFTLPNQQRTDNAQTIATSKVSEVNELLKLLDECQVAHRQCVQRCGP